MIEDHRSFEEHPHTFPSTGKDVDILNTCGKNRKCMDVEDDEEKRKRKCSLERGVREEYIGGLVEELVIR